MLLLVGYCHFITSKKRGGNYAENSKMKECGTNVFWLDSPKKVNLIKVLDERQFLKNKKFIYKLWQAVCF